MKKLTSFMLCLTIALTLVLLPVGAYAQATSEQASAFDELDLYITIGIHQKTEGIKPFSVLPKEITPLYDLGGNIFAYYVVMDDGSYMVVNASRENPALLEFGSEGYGNVNQLAKASNDGKLVYCGAGNFLTVKTNGKKSAQIYTNGKTEAILTAQDEAKINKFYDFCNEPNILKKTTLQETREAIGINGNKWSIYDLIKYENEIPADNFFALDIANYADVTYGNMNHFGHLESLDGSDIDNHCGATSAYNIISYYRYRLGNPISYEQMDPTFLLVHSYMKNGPFTPSQYNQRINSYIENETNYSILLFDPLETWEDYKVEVRTNRMCFMCVIPINVFEAHYINGMGYREYYNGSKYARVYDHWQHDDGMNLHRFYIFGEGLFQIGGVVIYEKGVIL